jgi:hypothetical protein
MAIRNIDVIAQAMVRLLLHKVWTEFFRAFSYPNWSGVSNTRHVSAFMA